MSNSIVISGATGCIGFALVDYFIKNGHKVLIILRPNSSRNHIFEGFSNITICHCELDGYDDLEIEGVFDVFYHFAWDGGKNRDDFDTNLNSARSAADAVELAIRLGCKLFVGAGSQAECGLQNMPISESTICNPVSAFGIAKLLSYHWTKLVCRKHGIRHCWLRILSVYGPYDGNQTLINSTIINFINNEPQKFTDGEQLWDYIYSEDAADIIGKIGLSNESTGIYIIASGNAIKLKYLITTIANYFEMDISSFLGLKKKMDNSIDYLCGDTSRLNYEFNWSPKISFNRGVEKTINYLRSQNA